MSAALAASDIVILALPLAADTFHMIGRDALKRMKDFPALEGSISFGADNDALKPVYIQEIRDGKWALLETHPAPN